MMLKEAEEKLLLIVLKVLQDWYECEKMKN